MFDHSRSLSRLENTIEPMADKVDDMHNKLNGDLNVKIDEMHHLMLSMASIESSPRVWPTRSESIASSAGAPLDELQRAQLNPLASPSLNPPDRSTNFTKHLRLPEETTEPEGSEFSSWPPQPKSSGGVSTIDSYLDPRESDLIPVGGCMSGFEEAPPRYEKSRQGLPMSPRNSSGSSQVLETDSQRRPSDISLPLTPGSPMMLPLPAIEPDSEGSAVRHNSHDFFSVTATESAPVHLTKTMTTETQHKAFERAIFQDAAVLCEV